MSVLSREQYTEPQINWEALKTATLVPPATRHSYGGPRRDEKTSAAAQPACECMEFCPLDHSNE